MATAKEKFVITIDCRAEDRDRVNDFITSLLYGPKDGSRFAEECEVILDDIFIDKEDY